MTFWAGFCRSALRLLLLMLLFCGCSQSGSGPLDEEKEPHFLAGKERVSTLDWKGAIESFEKALQVNPRSGAAHFELAWIYDQKEVDPAAAIYHYQHFLQLRPHGDNADMARQRITVCKQALAETVSLGPITEKVQHQFEQVVEDKKRLTEENKRLHEQLEQWTSYAARLETMTNQAAAPTRSVQTGAVAPISAKLQTRNADQANLKPASSTNSSPAPAPALRTHTVKSGETPSLIARKYSIKLQALMSANPNLDPRRMRIGEILRIPGS